MFSFDGAGELVAKPSGPVTVGGMPHPVNNTNRVPTVQVSPQVRDPTPHPRSQRRILFFFQPTTLLWHPQFYGGPITMPDGSLLATVGLCTHQDIAEPRL
eukprot:COSAG04_NODE_1658_length_6031_cov_2.111823_4_plen_100_part_00